MQEGEREEKGSLGRTVGRRDVRVHCRVSKLRSEATTARPRSDSDMTVAR